jgi:DNA processing protein
LQEPPTRLYLHGELPPGPAVAIVGTRHASARGRRFTRRLAAELSEAGVTVLSGGAKGIDRAAHEGAMAAGGSTVVVAPAGLQCPYPEQHEAFFHRVVAAGGGYVSLVPDDCAATRGAFFARNACLVALAHAVIVTETPHRSGSRNASSWARRIGRPLFVVAHSPWHAPGAGGVAELRLGALPLDRASDVLKFLNAAGLRGLPQRAVVEPAQPATGVSGQLALPHLEEDPVLAAVRSGACHVDEIAARSGLPVGVIQGRLLTLTLSGVLVPGPWGSVKLVTP